jgi:hypothetical protein
MQVIFKFFGRLIMLAAAVVLALSLLFIVVVLLALWCVRAVWCKLTGKPINPFSAAMKAAMQSRINPRHSFDRAFGSDAKKSARVRADDVTDVEAKDIR